jgi:hypothetical protein
MLELFIILCYTCMRFLLFVDNFPLNHSIIKNYCFLCINYAFIPAILSSFVDFIIFSPTFWPTASK